MDNIYFQLFALSISAERMKTLKAALQASKKTPPTPQGGGQTAAELEQIARRLSEMNDSLALLIGNSAAMLESARTSMLQADEGIAKLFRSVEGLANLISADN